MSSSDFQPLQGMSDIVHPEVDHWIQLEQTARELMVRYGYTEIRTPILEKTAVFSRSLGDDTDVVQKEMYTFKDRGDRSVTLRPEGTASVMRCLAGMGQYAQGARLYYMGPMFRYERPQAGRKRQLHQFGIETIGEPNPAADVEALALQMDLLRAWGIDDGVLHINTRGLPGDRQAVMEGIRAALKPLFDQLCEDCQRRYDHNVLRVIDCKNPGCQQLVSELPAMSEFMSEESRIYLENVRRLLDHLDIPYELNNRLVRGLDYYVHTVWEVKHHALGAQDSISGGGRYQVMLNNKALDGVGFAVGLERILAALEALERLPENTSAPVTLVSLGDDVLADNMEVLQTLRRYGVAAVMDLSGKSMKAQMRMANRNGSRHVVIRGRDELDRGVFVLKDMQAGTQEELALPELMQRLISD